MADLPRAGLTAWLTALSRQGYAVAKSPDLWANLDRGGDWDLLVDDVEGAIELLPRLVGAPSKIVQRAYVSTVIYPWGHIDLLPAIQWRSVLLASAGEVIADSRRDGNGVSVAATKHQVLAACLYPLLAHGSFRKKYLSLLTDLDADGADALRWTIHRVFGLTVEDVESFIREVDPRELRRRAALRSLSSPRGWRRLAEFAWREVIVRTGARLTR